MTAVLAVSACATEPELPLELRSVTVEQLGGARFGVSVDAQNVDGYELARCVAAAYTFSQVGDDGARLYPFYVRDGGKITDEFRRVDGVRVQNSYGVQTYSFATTDQYSVEDHDGRDVMAVDLQMAKCEKQGLPTTLGDS